MLLESALQIGETLVCCRHRCPKSSMPRQPHTGAIVHRRQHRTCHVCPIDFRRQFAMPSRRTSKFVFSAHRERCKFCDNLRDRDQEVAHQRFKSLRRKIDRLSGQAQFEVASVKKVTNNEGILLRAMTSAAVTRRFMRGRPSAPALPQPRADQHQRECRASLPGHATASTR